MHTLKKFIPYYSPYRAVFVLDLICAAMISLIDLAYPQILRTMTKTVFAGKSSAILQGFAADRCSQCLSCTSFRRLCKYYVSYQGHMMGANMERDMRQQLFDHYEKLSFSYYDQNNSGQMMSKLVSDLFDISEMAHHGPENLIYIIDKNYRFVCVFVCDQSLACHSAFGTRVFYDSIFLWTEPQNAGNLYGQPTKDRRYQFQSCRIP